jgi:predicted nucleotidyltransferase
VASNFLEILNQLHDHHVEFVIVGGVAAALHGSSRVTFDLDVVPSLAEESWQATVDLLWSLGARPRIPEPLGRIRDVEQVRRWQHDKGMLALSFRTPDGSTEVDLLVSESDRLASLRERAVRITIEQRTFFVASIDDLIAMKRQAGRPQDLLDIAQLLDIQARLGRPGSE